MCEWLWKAVDANDAIWKKKSNCYRSGNFSFEKPFIDRISSFYWNIISFQSFFQLLLKLKVHDGKAIWFWSQS